MFHYTEVYGKKCHASCIIHRCVVLRRLRNEVIILCEVNGNPHQPPSWFTSFISSTFLSLLAYFLLLPVWQIAICRFYHQMFFPAVFFLGLTKHHSLLHGTHDNHLFLEVSRPEVDRHSVKHLIQKSCYIYLDIAIEVIKLCLVWTAHDWPRHPLDGSNMKHFIVCYLW